MGLVRQRSREWEPALVSPTFVAAKPMAASTSFPPALTKEKRHEHE